MSVDSVWLRSIYYRENHMQQRNNSKNNRNYLIKCTYPNCTNQSEHSHTRVQKVLR
ncbi:hypothetical protein [Klebsiella variicola]